MNETTTLSCKFRDSQGQSHSINIDNPAGGLSSEKITDSMLYILDSGVLVTNETQPDLKFISIPVASVTRKSVENISLD